MKQLSNNKLGLVLIANLLLFSFFIATSALGQAKKAPVASAKGKALYDDKCAHCHGIEGKGDGDGAENLLPRPRDFTRGLYKIRSTESGQLPTDQDLFDIIAKGMPGSSMPPWEASLNSDQMWQLVAHIKTFHDGFKEATSLRTINTSGKVAYAADSVQRGEKLYTDLGCVECHGEVGRGDGTSAPDLTDEWGFRTWPANMAQPWTFRGGTTTDDIFKRFIGGIAGSPMPSFISSFRVGLTNEQSARMTALENKMDAGDLSDAEQTEYEKLEETVFEFEDIMLKIEEGEQLTPQERQKLDVALKPVYESSWHLANYVKSLGPKERPQPAVGDKVLRSQYLTGELPGMADEAWNDVEASYYPLVGQVIIDPRNFNPSIDSVSAKSFYNDNEIVFLFTWDDRTKSLLEEDEETGEMTEDALTVQFPVKVPQGPTDPKPYFIWGGRRAVNLWYWKASEEDKVIEANAKGINQLSVQPTDSQILQSESVYDKGQYRLWVKRTLTTDDKRNDIQFESGVFTPIAFSAWDGSNGEFKAKRAISTWYTFVLEPVPSNKRFIYPPLVALISLGALFALTGAVRRRENNNMT